VNETWDHKMAAKAMISRVLCLPSFSSYADPLLPSDVLCDNSSEEEWSVYQ